MLRNLSLYAYFDPTVYVKCFVLVRKKGKVIIKG